MLIRLYGRSDKRSESVICLLLFILGLILAALVAPLWFDPGDDGLYMYQANLVMHGGLPYRDFLLHDAPLGSAWHALLLTVFGNDLLVLRLAIVPVKAALLPGIYLLARPLVPRAPAVAAGFAVMVLDTANNYTAPHVAMNALVLGVGTVLALARWLATPQRRWLVLAGALIGVATGFKQNMGLYLLVGTCLWLLDPDLRHTGQLPIWFGRALATLRFLADRRYLLPVGAWGGVVLAVLWLVHDHLEFAVLFSLVVPIIALAGWMIWRCFPHYPPTWNASWIAEIQRLLAVGLGFALTTLPWLGWYGWQVGPGTLFNGLILRPSQLGASWFLPLRVPIPDFWWFLVLLGAPVGGACLLLLLTRWLPANASRPWIIWSGLGVGLALVVFTTPLLALTGNGLIYIWLYFNILVFWPAFLLLLRLRSAATRAYVSLLLISATFFALQMYPQMRRINANWCFHLYLPLAAWLLWRLGRHLRHLARGRVRRQIGALPSTALCLLPLLTAGWVVQWRVAAYLDIPATLHEQRLIATTELVPLNLPHFHVWDTPQNRSLYQRAVTAIQAAARPGDPIYCLCRLVAFYVATEHPAGVKDVYVTPKAPVNTGLALREELIQSNTRVILAEGWVFDPTAPCDVIGLDQEGTWAVPLRDYITTAFEKTETLDSWSLWTKNP